MMRSGQNDSKQRIGSRTGEGRKEESRRVTGDAKRLRIRMTRRGWGEMTLVPHHGKGQRGTYSIGMTF